MGDIGGLNTGGGDTGGLNTGGGDTGGFNTGGEDTGGGGIGGDDAGGGNTAGGPAVPLTCPPLAEQRHFLAAMGMEARVNALLRAAPDSAARNAIMEGAMRLVGDPGMGTAYKAIAIAHPSLGRNIPGFARSPTEQDV